jgi:hypothetical protein
VIEPRVVFGNQDGCFLIFGVFVILFFKVFLKDNSNKGFLSVLCFTPNFARAALLVHLKSCKACIMVTPELTGDGPILRGLGLLTSLLAPDPSGG